MKNAHGWRASAAAIKCELCGGQGASLTGECQRQEMTEIQRDAVALGILDYRYGRWSEVANSVYAFADLNCELQTLNVDSSRAVEITAILESSEYRLDNRIGIIIKKAMVIHC